ncbi:phenylacetate--CoA ligase family protein [Taklimakanibacter lacteus]|uniref:phenylacetate--CoA ligase family protein n=1 Tax=Taklimakanibacter lacteus TaxID=2268456 RepID=UPI000E66ED7C
MPTEREAARLFYDTLMYTQWLSRQDIEAYQRQQLSQLLHHAAHTTSFYRDRLSKVLLQSGRVDWDRWHEVPVLTRSDVRSRQAEMTSSAIPQVHGRLTQVSTSGTSGVPITVTATRLADIARNVARWRLHSWHELDWSKPMALALGQDPGKSVWPDGRVFKPWGPYWVSHRGLRHVIEVITPVDRLVEWLNRTGAAYFTAMPVTLAAVAEESVRQGKQIKLGATISFGMQARPEYRRVVQERLDVPIIEVYGSEECGPIAMQCRKGALHINSELVRVEIVDDDGSPCPPGVQGRVIVTVLHNAAQPLIRYEQGDLAALAESCDCGLQLPVLGPVSGRIRHLFQFGEGGRFMPSGHVTTEIVGAHLRASWYQIAQTGLNRVEVRFVSPANLSEADLEHSRHAFRTSMGGKDIDIVHKRFDSPPLKPGQKYIEFVNEHAPPDT